MLTRSAICAYPPRLKQRAPRPISPAARKLSGGLHATHRGGWGFCTGLGMTERGGIWQEGHRVANANPLGALRDGPVEDFRRRAVGKFPQEVVLDRPEVRKADLVSQFHLGHHLLVALLLDAVIVGFWYLDFIHEPKLHGSVLHMRSRALFGREAGQGWFHGVSTCILCPDVDDLQAEAVA